MLSSMEKNRCWTIHKVFFVHEINLLLKVVYAFNNDIYFLLTVWSFMYISANIQREQNTLHHIWILKSQYTYNFFISLLMPKARLNFFDKKFSAVCCCHCSRCKYLKCSSSTKKTRQLISTRLGILWWRGLKFVQWQGRVLCTCKREIILNYWTFICFFFKNLLPQNHLLTKAATYVETCSGSIDFATYDSHMRIIW